MYSIFGCVRGKTFSWYRDFVLRFCSKATLWIVWEKVWKLIWRIIVEEFRGLLEESLRSVLKTFVVTFVEFSDDFWGDCDCQQDKFSGGIGRLLLLCWLKIFTVYTCLHFCILVWHSVCLAQSARLFRIANKSLKNPSWKPEVKLNGTLWERTRRGRAL